MHFANPWKDGQAELTKSKCLQTEIVLTGLLNGKILFQKRFPGIHDVQKQTVKNGEIVVEELVLRR